MKNQPQHTDRLKAELEAKYGKVWTTEEAKADFEFHGFCPPYVEVIRKADSVKGTLQFIHDPRFYFDFLA